MFCVYIDGNLAQKFNTRLEAKDFCFIQYALLGNFHKSCFEIKEE